MIGTRVPKPGDVIADKYVVDRTLGEGGMGVVLAATHIALRQKVAIKFMLAGLEDATARARFLREARAAAQIQNEHVVRVLDVSELVDGTPYMVMEHLDGHDLEDELARRGRLPVAEAVDCLLQASEAIAEAHAHGIVHRDLKPANLFVATKRDGSHTVKVLDFGISKEMTTQDVALTSTAQAMGSPLYMSPEQVRSAKNVDERTDIWALGAILHELIANRPPFHGDTLGQVLAAIVADPPPSLRSVRAEIPVDLDAIVARCLEKDASRRFSSVAELARALLPFSPGSAASVTRIETLLGNVASSGALADTVGVSALTELPPPSQQERPPSLASVPVTVGGASTSSAWAGTQAPTPTLVSPLGDLSTKTRLSLPRGLAMLTCAIAGAALLMRGLASSPRDPHAAVVGGAVSAESAPPGPSSSPTTIPSTGAPAQSGVPASAAASINVAASATASASASAAAPSATDKARRGPAMSATPNKEAYDDRK